MVSLSSLSRGVMGNSDSVCSVAHAAGRAMGVGWGEKHRSMRGGREARGEGACFFVSFSKWWEGVLTSPKSHTLQKDTTPSSWGQREREHRKEMGGKQKTQRRRQKARQDTR